MCSSRIRPVLADETQDGLQARSLALGARSSFEEKGAISMAAIVCVSCLFCNANGMQNQWWGDLRPASWLDAPLPCPGR